MQEKIDCGKLMKHISDRMEKHANEQFGVFGITYMQMHMLMQLYERQEDVPLKLLERHYDVAQSTAAGIISRLEKKGLIYGFSPEEDRRRKLIRLTEAGRRLCEQVEEKKQEGNAFLLAGLNAEERDEFARLLKKIHDAME